VRALVQRVQRARVTVDGRETGSIQRGFLVLLGACAEDGEAAADWLAGKVARLRLFDDPGGRMNLDLAAVGGAALVVPQFTLYGDVRRGRRPDFTRAAPPERAGPLVERFCGALAALGVPVERGEFRAHMLVELVNDGPVTILVESPGGES
jgi:D-tyrosyl-tRNA(Tyr) deacylase